ncbi:unnamed protein product [Ambrosiozyma monospora]|uniref:Unnamed protein product n=1 Tax=Ambrosiozyma monospora TaxID=43982 RepID=A0ACB5T817_AMBMO|nr:unnamed protein product [Ambrosiozyma monospora]
MSIRLISQIAGRSLFVRHNICLSYRAIRFLSNSSQQKFQRNDTPALNTDLQKNNISETIKDISSLRNTHNSKTVKHTDLKTSTLEDVIKQIPHGNQRVKVIYCINATDFPLGLSKKFRHLLKTKSVKPENIFYVITKIDSVTKQYQNIDLNDLKKYFRIGINKYLETIKFEVPSDKIFLTSNKRKESIDTFVSFMQQNHGSDLYFIGESNSGKSTLTHAMVKQSLLESPDQEESNSYYRCKFTPSDTPFKTRRNMEYSVPHLDMQLVISFT